MTNAQIAVEAQNEARAAYENAHAAFVAGNVFLWGMEMTRARNYARVARVWRSGSFIGEDILFYTDDGKPVMKWDVMEAVGDET